MRNIDVDLELNIRENIVSVGNNLLGVNYAMLASEIDTMVSDNILYTLRLNLFHYEPRVASN